MPHASGSRRASPAGRRSTVSAKALGELLTAFAADLARMQRATPPIGLVQVARYADPENSSATVLLALLLDGQDRSDEALALLRVDPAARRADQPRRATSRCASCRTSKRLNEAYAIAAPAAAASGAGVSDFSRLGELYQAMKRHNEAADAYGRAIALARRPGGQERTVDAAPAPGERARKRQSLARGHARRWSRRWRSRPSSRCCSTSSATRKLERGEDLDAAEAMIRKASELAPGRCLDHQLARLGAVQARQGRRSDRDASARRREGSRPGRDPRASRRCAVSLGPALRGALRVERGADHRRGRHRRAGPGQARRRA